MGWSEKVGDHRQDPPLPRTSGLFLILGCWFEFGRLGQVQFEGQIAMGQCLTTDLVLGSA